METSVTEIADARVRVDVNVDPADVESRLRRAAEGLGRQLKVPGFRKGKVPPEIVIQRVGREAVLEEALQGSLPEWYERAMLAAGVNAVGEPDLKVEGLPAEGEPLSFSIEVAVRPKARLGEYKGLEVGKAEPEVPADAVDAEIDRLREGFASLQPVERAAAEGDLLVIDYSGSVDGEPFEGGEARDHMVELGAGRLLEQFESALPGKSAGDEVEVEVDFPDDYRPESLAGKKAKFAITVKEVREKQLPELDDDFAGQASEFDTLAELRAEIEGKIRHAMEHRVEDEFREAAIDAAVANASVEMPEEIVTARAGESWERLARQLAAQGIDPETYLKMQGKSADEVIADAKPDAEQSLKREAVLEAVVEAEPVEVSEEEMLEALVPAAERESRKPEAVLEQLREQGRDALLRSDLRMRKAVDVIAEAAKPIPLERAAAREKLWTPGKPT
ncbi:MAG: trigger factor [Solirubrobacterales bacterium]|jgi:trigger factor|nr:trigger factor [Solirubrobacterales bacterium]